MSRLTVIAAMFLGLLTTCETALGVNLWYDFEGDSGTLATDKYDNDGTQNGQLIGNTTIDSFAIWGDQSAFFDIPDPGPQVAPPYSTLEIPDTTFGADFSLTVAGFMDNREDPLGFTRVFSSYRGTGPVAADRIIFDVDATGGQIPGMRAIVGNTAVVTAAPPPGLLDPGYHHYAMTINAGNVSLFLDGSEVANGPVASGYTNEYNIFIGEDPHDGGGSANEQLIGNFDEVLVINRAPSPANIASLAQGNTVSSVVTPQAGETAVYYDFEGDSGQLATDKFNADGSQDGMFTLNSSVDQVQANARLGSSSGTFGDPRDGLELNPFSQINVGAVGNLGSTFTLSASINMLGAETGGGLARLFSTFKGSGPPGEGDVIFDVNPNADVDGIGMRLLLPGGTVTASNTFTMFENHTMTAVYDNGTVTLYLDGVAVATDTVTSGDVDLLDKELRIGEDTGGAVNENFLGNMDDILVRSDALTPQQAMLLHTMGASALPPPTTTFFDADFDEDGDVDGDDFLLWQTGFGTPSGATKMDGDYDNDGDVDGDDFLGWQAEFGLPDGGQGTGAVPEPTSLVLLLCLIAGGLAFRRKLAG